MKNDLIRIAAAFLVLILVVLAGFASLLTKPADTSKSQIVADNKISDLMLNNYGIQWSPDGHISYITFPNGERRYFIAGNQRSYMITSKNNQTLDDAIKNNAKIEAVFNPDPNYSYKNNYAAISEVLQTDKNNPYHIFAFTQFEEQAVKPDGSFNYGNFTASIGLLESYDGGLTWKDFGPIVKGDDYLPPGTKITGAGEPSAIIKGDYVYLYYVDWSSQTKVFHSDQIYLARSFISPNGALNPFEFYTTNGFSNQEQNLAPVITPPTKESDYVSLPSVSFNKYIGSYLMVYEINNGFMSSVSKDGINWTNPKKIFSFPQAQSNRQSGDIWYSYASFLSDGTQPSDQYTDKNGNLYFSKGIWPNTAHEPVKQSISIQ